MLTLILAVVSDVGVNVRFDVDMYVELGGDVGIDLSVDIVSNW